MKQLSITTAGRSLEGEVVCRDPVHAAVGNQGGAAADEGLERHHGLVAVRRAQGRVPRPLEQPQPRQGCKQLLTQPTALHQTVAQKYSVFSVSFWTISSGAFSPLWPFGSAPVPPAPAPISFDGLNEEWANVRECWQVAQSQSFVNECRRALGLSMKFWVAEIHEIVKNTILHYSDIRGKLGELNDALKQLDLTATPHKIRSTPSKVVSAVTNSLHSIPVLPVLTLLILTHDWNFAVISPKILSIELSNAHVRVLLETIE